MSSADQVFTLFPLLPTELRLKIWALNLPPPRLVPVKYTYLPSPTSPRTINSQTIFGCTSTASIPVNLHVCQEARNEAHMTYEPSFNLPHGRRKIFFSKKADILYFPGSPNREGRCEQEYYKMAGLVSDAFKDFTTASSMIQPSELRKVRRLAVHEDLFLRTDKSFSSSRMREFWDLVWEKYKEVREVAVFVENRPMARRCDLIWDMQAARDEVAWKRNWEAPTWDISVLDKGMEMEWPFDRAERR